MTSWERGERRIGVGAVTVASLACEAPSPTGATRRRRAPAPGRPLVSPHAPAAPSEPALHHGRRRGASRGSGRVPGVDAVRVAPADRGRGGGRRTGRLERAGRALHAANPL